MHTELSARFFVAHRAVCQYWNCRHCSAKILQTDKEAHHALCNKWKCHRCQKKFPIAAKPEHLSTCSTRSKILTSKGKWECCYCNKRFSMNKRAAHLAICNFDRSGNCRSKISRRNVAAHATTSPYCFQKFPRERKDVHEAECWRCRRCLAQLPRSQQKTHSLTCKYWICARCEKQMSLTDKAHHRWSVCQA